MLFGIRYAAESNPPLKKSFVFLRMTGNMHSTVKTSALIFLFCISFTLLLGKIRNGYEMDIPGMISSIKGLHTILEDESILTHAQHHKVKDRLKKLIDHVSYYRLTDELLQQFRRLSPDTYAEMDNIQDKRGRAVDVYIKFIPRRWANVPLSGVTFFMRSSKDEDAHHSEYGENSISIEVCTGPNSLLLLYHELGHAKYIVPNLASYARTYFRKYEETLENLYYSGHGMGDRSGEMAKKFEKKYLHDQSIHKKNYGTKQEPVLAILQRILKSNRINESTNELAIVAQAPN